MSGVRVGSRLEQLLDLRRQVTVQIEVERRANPTEATRLGLTKTKRRPKDRTAAPNVVQRRLADLGVTTYDVKVWAVEAGILPAVKQGRIGIALVEQYATAHPMEDA